MDRDKQKCMVKHAQNARADLSHVFWKSHSGICSSLIHFIASNDYVSGQQRPWSDCADAQADLGLGCPHMIEDTFSHSAANMVITLAESLLIKGKAILFQGEATLLKLF